MALYSNLIKAILAAVVLAAVVILFFPGNQKKAIEKLLEKGHAAIEAGNVKAVMALVSLSYHDDLGFNYGAVQGSFGYTFSVFKNIKVDYRVVGFKPGKDTCIAEISARVHGFWTTANREADIAGAENYYEQVFIVCKKEAGRWKVISTKWPNRKDSLKMYSMNYIIRF
jgi:hypothetical protein